MKRSRKYQELAARFEGEHTLSTAVALLTSLGASGAVTMVSPAGIRTAVVHDLPHGRGRPARVALFSEQPIPAGILDGSTLSTKELLGMDAVVAHPSQLRLLPDMGRLGRAGLLPRRETQTLGVDEVDLALAYRNGRVMARADREGNLSVLVGNLSMSSTELEENCRTALTRPAVLVGHSLPRLIVVP